MSKRIQFSCTLLLPFFFACDSEGTTGEAEYRSHSEHGESAEAVVRQESANELAGYVASMEAGRTRAGTLRFRSPALQQPGAVELIVKRLKTGNDSSEVRVALAEALGVAKGDFVTELSSLWPTEADYNVQAMLLRAASHHSNGHSHLIAPVVLQGLRHSSAEVQIEATRILAKLNLSKLSPNFKRELSDELFMSLERASRMGATQGPSQQAELRRSILWTLSVVGESIQDGFPDSKIVVRSYLDDIEPKVRYQALRTLNQLDSSMALSEVNRRRLLQSQDPKMVRLASGITNQLRTND